MLKRILIFALLLAPATLLAQGRKKVFNLPAYDNRVVHFGFLIGINSSDFRISVNRTPGLFDSIKGVESKNASGFNLGIIGNLHLGNFMDLRFIPALAFSSRTLVYSIDGSKGSYTRTKDIESTFIELPLLFKYKSERHNNFRAYIIGGIKYTYDMASQKGVKDDLDNIIVKVRDGDYGFDIGVGFDFYAQYFKFSPEIRYTFGIRDVLIREGNPYTNTIDRLTSKIILISFNFE
jgi:hypothetical protein